MCVLNHAIIKILLLHCTGSTLKTRSLSSRLYSIKAHSSLAPTVVYAHSLPPTVQSVSLFSTSSQPPTTQSTDTEDDEETRSRELKRLRIALIVGPAWFVLLMYLCFFREEKEGGIIDYLNQDIRHNKRLPPDVQQKAKELYGNSDK